VAEKHARASVALERTACHAARCNGSHEIAPKLWRRVALHRRRTVVLALHLARAMQDIIVVSSDRSSSREDAINVSTPLDAIVRLEHRKRVRTVVLAGTFARDRELAAFLGELYPSIRIECEA
jgi:hypothetical protein